MTTAGEPEQSQVYATATQPVTFKLDSGRILLMWAGHNGTSVRSYQRMPVTVAYTDDNGETWQGYQEVSGRHLINNPFGYPMALQPDFVYAEDGSLTWAIWVRGTIYYPDGSWVSIHMDDFDKWLEENTGAYDDFEQSSIVKGNYWYEMGPRVGVSSEYSVSGNKSLRVADNSSIDTALAVRNFMGTTKGELSVSLNYTSSNSGLRLALYECEPAHVDEYGGMYALDVAKDGTLSWVGANDSLTSTGVKLELGKWYNITMQFDVEAGTMDVLVDGAKVATAGCMEQQSIIAYFAAHSTGLQEKGTEFYLDDLIVIDNEDADVTMNSISEERVPDADAVVRINDVLYDSLAEAVENVRRGQTIVMLKDADPGTPLVRRETSFSVDTNGFRFNHKMIKCVESLVYQVTYDSENKEILVFNYYNGPGGNAPSDPPVVPEKPEKPETPETPEKPEKPDVPSEPAETEKPSISFTDVKPAHWFYDAVNFVTAEGLMNGVGDDKFNPNGKLTRAMMWTILARMDGVDTTGGASWYEKGQKWAMDNGISDGTSSNANITREQLVTMLWRYLGEPEAEGDLNAFVDGSKVSSWAQDAMTWAVANKVISGKGDGVLDPQGYATRAEVAQIFKNYFSK